MKKVAPAKTTKKKAITIDDLAVLITKGLAETNKRISGIDERMTKGFAEVNEKIAEGREETQELARMVARSFEHVDERFAGVNKRLDNIENRLLINHDNRLDRIEDKIRILETSRR